jgi:ParB family chromosome partitioning protein
MKIPVDNVRPNPQQPRKHFDAEYINGLAQSIKANGLQNPILVEDHGKENYILVSGECRLRAHKILGRKKIEATVRPPTNHAGKQRLIDAMIENVSRENMTTVDEGNGYRSMREVHKMSVTEISMTIGRTEQHVRSRLFITDLDLPIQELIALKMLPHDSQAVEALLSIPDPELRIEMARRFADRGLGIKMIVKHCEKFLNAKKEARKARMKYPAMEIARITAKPDGWDALYQVGRVPQWQKFTESVMETCDDCSLRPIACEATCRDCPLVSMCFRIMEKAK